MGCLETGSWYILDWSWTCCVTQDWLWTCDLPISTCLSAGHRYVTIPSGVIFFPLKYLFQKCALTFSINFSMRIYNALGQTQDSESMKDLTIHSNREGLPQRRSAVQVKSECHSHPTPAPWCVSYHWLGYFTDPGTMRTTTEWMCLGVGFY